jgi:hypothetical protein
MDNIPSKIFITGAPGSGWAVIATQLENRIGADVSHHDSSYRMFNYYDSNLSKYKKMHSGVFFGTGMEFPADLNIIDEPFIGNNTRVYRSHEWVYKLDEIRERFSDAWIMFVNRLDDNCFNWWKYVGGFDITYPNYEWYQDDETMLQRIKEQNKIMLQFCNEHNIEWVDPEIMFEDVTPIANEDKTYIAIYKPEKEENNV